MTATRDAALADIFNAVAQNDYRSAAAITADVRKSDRAIPPCPARTPRKMQSRESKPLAGPA